MDAKCEIVDVDLLSLVVAIVTRLLTVLLVTFIIRETVCVVMTTSGDVISEWTGCDDVMTWRGVVGGNWWSSVADAVCPRVALLLVVLVVLVEVLVVLVEVLVVVVVVVSMVMLSTLVVMLIAPVSRALTVLDTASDNKLITNDVSDDVTNDDRVDRVVRDVDDADVDISSATVASDVTTWSRDVGTVADVLAGDVVTVDDVRLLLLPMLLTLDESCTDFVDVVMVTSLLGYADDCTEPLTPVLDC